MQLSTRSKESITRSMFAKHLLSARHHPRSTTSLLHKTQCQSSSVFFAWEIFYRRTHAGPSHLLISICISTGHSSGPSILPDLRDAAFLHFIYLLYHFKEVGIITPILQKRKLRLRNIKQVPQGLIC